MKCGFYKRPYLANRRLSEWNVIINPVQKNKTIPCYNPKQEWQITVDYSYIEEIKPRNLIELAQETHEYLSHPSHKIFC
jgi:hypothetical protein